MGGHREKSYAIFGRIMTQPWYPFFWSDYSGSTFNLTQGQHGAHLLFMRHIYTTGKPIPDKQRFSIARALSEQEQADADYVLAAHYKRDGENWHSEKCETVMAEAENKHQRRVDAGKKGGQAKSSNAKVMLEQSPSNHNHNHNDIGTNVPISSSLALLFDMPFQSLWHAYLGLGKHGDLSEGYKGSRKTAQAAYFKILKSAKEQDREKLIRDIADGANRYAEFLKRAGQRCQYLSTWLNANGWETDYAVDRPAGDPSQRGAGYGQKASYSDTVFAAAGQAIDHIQRRDGGRDRSAEREGGPARDDGLPALGRIAN